MSNKNPYHVIKHQHVTEKAKMLQELKNAESNVSVRRCKSPKYVFIVDIKANKQEIATALEEIYSENNIKVVGVNTNITKPKPKSRRGRVGFASAYKKAVVTLRDDDSLDNV